MVFCDFSLKLTQRLLLRNLPVIRVSVTRVVLILLLLIVLQVFKIPRQYQLAYWIFTNWFQLLFKKIFPDLYQRSLFIETKKTLTDLLSKESWREN